MFMELQLYRKCSINLRFVGVLRKTDINLRFFSTAVKEHHGCWVGRSLPTKLRKLMSISLRHCNYPAVWLKRDIGCGRKSHWASKVLDGFRQSDCFYHCNFPVWSLQEDSVGSIERDIKDISASISGFIFQQLVTYVFFLKFSCYR